MSKFADDTTVLDALLDGIAQCNVMHLCSAQPASFAGIAALSLGNVSMTPVTDYTKANGSVSGRKVTTAAKNGVSTPTAGSITHIVLARTTDSTLRYVTTCALQTTAAGGSVNVPGWSVEIADPS